MTEIPKQRTFSAVNSPRSWGTLLLPPPPAEGSPGGTQRVEYHLNLSRFEPLLSCIAVTKS